MQKTLPRYREYITDIDPMALGSGAVAQVHRATLKSGEEVVLKVLHPSSVSDVILDLCLMRVVVSLSYKIIPGINNLSVAESFQEFSKCMLNQLDLELEACNLLEFRKNFEKFPQVVFPSPIIPLSSHLLLVESHEGGENVFTYLHKLKGTLSPEEHTRLSKRIAVLGLNSYLKMMLVDHFIHADLHPGNILIRPNRTQYAPPTSWLKSKLERFYWKHEENSIENSFEVVILDTGLVTKINAEEAKLFIELFKAVVNGDGLYAAELMLQHAPGAPTSPENANKWRKEMGTLFQSVKNKKLKEIEVGKFLTQMFHLSRTCQVKLKGNFSTLMVGTIVLEGLGRQLDPDINFLEQAIPFFVQNRTRDLDAKTGINVLGKL